MNLGKGIYFSEPVAKIKRHIKPNNVQITLSTKMKVFGCISNCRINKCKFSEPNFLCMTKEQLIASVTAHYDELAALNKIDNFYDYESDFIKLWAKMGREVLEKNISTLPGDRRKKNSNRFRGTDNSQKPPL